MSRYAGKDPIDEAEQQRLRDEEEARRIEARRLEIEQQPNPPSVLQYFSPPLSHVPWSPFGLCGDPGVSQDDLWDDLGRGVHISYDEMHWFTNEEDREKRKDREEREESSSSSNNDNAGGGGEEDDIPVPQVLISLKRGRRSTSGSGFVVNVRGN